MNELNSTSTDKIDKIEKIKKEIRPRVDIVKDIKIQYDGKQYMIKIPKEISSFYNIKKGNEFRFIVKPVEKGRGENSFEIIKNE